MKTKILMMLLAGIILLAACKGKHGSEEFVNNNASSADSARITDFSPVTPKIVKTADMHFKVKNVQQVSEKITALTTSYKGLVMHHQVGSSELRSTDIHKTGDSIIRVTAFSNNAEMTVKIPSEKLEDFMNEVGRLGIYVTNRQLDLSDKSLDYLAAQLKLQSRKELIDQQKKGKVIIKNPANVLLLKDDMVDQQISNRQIDDAVKYSVVSLSFYQSNTIYKETIANDDPSAYNLPFFKRFIECIGNDWMIFELFILGLANIWVFLVVGFGIWVLIRYYRAKRVAIVKN
ncbi:DUF4349 domain-containing protein [Mucilaginibacter sp. BJC16-A38]|uniref:DUF4349 domain-containing protein n=1 Tax=Mucilaginibacter phenanthrenivorans TaxID=1234842 RepID=UPI00215757C7|nr:DUF4349 domain-containing protein [Mucilaginibacter phenanthrenivorans]MCR8558728.1 DUF4349 domain-containing protein [Mucilaginibacter phenanthrenivorans]